MTTGVLKAGETFIEITEKEMVELDVYVYLGMMNKLYSKDIDTYFYELTKYGTNFLTNLLLKRAGRLN